jgi:hypothetical protein
MVSKWMFLICGSWSQAHFKIPIIWFWKVNLFEKISNMSKFMTIVIYIWLCTIMESIFSKCQYTHFEQIGLSFGYTDEKVDLGIYLNTYTSWPFSTTRQWWNSGETVVPSFGNVIDHGTAVRQLFHPWTMMEQRWDSCSIIGQWWNSGEAIVSSLGEDGTAVRQLLHHWAMMEQRWDRCSIIGQWWNSGETAVPSSGNDGTAVRQLFRHQTWR